MIYFLKHRYHQKRHCLRFYEFSLYKNSRETGEWDLISYPQDRIGNPVINSIELGDSVAWIGTSNGLARINTSALNLREEELKPKLEEEESYE